MLGLFTPVALQPALTAQGLLGKLQQYTFELHDCLLVQQGATLRSPRRAAIQLPPGASYTDDIELQWVEADS